MKKELHIEIDMQTATVEEVEAAAYKAQQFADELRSLARERRQHISK